MMSTTYVRTNLGNTLGFLMRLPVPRTRSTVGRGARHLSITSKQLFIRIGDRSLSYADFQRAIGDERARILVCPSVWLFDQDAKPLLQMPAGTGTVQTVPEQLEILPLER
jgi:hypothetical protein